MNAESAAVLAAIRKLSDGTVGVPVEAHRIALESRLSEGQVVVALDLLKLAGLAQPCYIGGQLMAAGAVLCIPTVLPRRSIFTFRRSRTAV